MCADLVVISHTNQLVVIIETFYQASTHHELLRTVWRYN